MNIAAVSYLNTAPLIQGLAALQETTLLRAVPSKIAEMVQSGEADIGLASIIDYAQSQYSPTPLTLIPAGMIGCDGPTLTVRLFSSVPINEISTVHADTDSHTSVALCKLILKEVHNITPDFIDYDTREHFPPNNADDPTDSNSEPQTLLMIGDKVVTASPPAVRYPHQIDLGQAWHDLTNLSFVYATWMCKSSDLSDPESKANIIATAHILERTMLKNQTRIDWLVATHAKRTGWPTDLAQDYIGNLLRFKVDDRAKESVATFLTKLADHDLLPEPVEPTWLNLATQEAPAPAFT
ncbi:MAG: menaquinone biosynthesis protein [Phycisphaerales bacterium]|nr:menaquinone biosynthesis protein [Phycisphaerales bacterium]